MCVHRLVSATLLGVSLWSLATTSAEAGFVLRDVRAREILDPIGRYEADLVLTGLPGTFVQGSTNPALRDFVTIFDIPDLANATLIPDGWFTSVQPFGMIPSPPPPGLPPDTILPNITFSYIAGNPIPLGSNPELLIGKFVFQTFDVDPLILLRSLNYVWQTSRRLSDGSVIRESGVGTVDVDVFGAVPEPASMLMTAAGFSLLGLTLGIRRRRSRTARS